jgi:hypothetical protein
MRHFRLIPDGEYELVQFDEQAQWVVRDEHGDVYSEEQHSVHHVVEVLVEGRWLDANAPQFAYFDWRSGTDRAQ